MFHWLLTLAFSFLGGAICTFLAVSILVPMIVGILGEHRFAEASAVEPCSYILTSGVISAILFASVSREGQGWYGYGIFPLVGLASAAMAVLGLWIHGAVGKKQEFVLRDAQIVRSSDRTFLAPLWAETDTDYTQTDATHGYSLYGLTLCDASGRLARNVYLSEEKRRGDLHTILETPRPTPCRALDLYLVRRETPLRWLQVRLSQERASLLCRPLTRLSPEGQDWWSQWLRPQFPEEGHRIVPREELSAHLEELFLHYAHQLDQVEQANLRTLIRLADGPLEMMTSCYYERMQREIAPEGGDIHHDPDERIRLILQPRGNAPTPEQSLLRPVQSPGETNPAELLRPDKEA